jgi:regulatory protein
MPFSQRKIYNLEEVREKIRHYCAYQERSQKQAREKLLAYGLLPHIADDLLLELLQDDFVNEERFALAFAKGKVNSKQWGRRKIEMALRQHGVSKPCIAQALNAIDHVQYRNNMQKLVARKFNSLKGLRNNARKQKTITYLMGKGYYFEEFKSMVDSIAQT